MRENSPEYNEWFIFITSKSLKIVLREPWTPLTLPSCSIRQQKKPLFRIAYLHAGGYFSGTIYRVLGD